MSRTLKDLFQKQPISGLDGKTASEFYTPRDSKRNTQVLSSNNPLMSPAFAAVSILRKNSPFSIKGETVLEQETLGLRPLRLTSIPVLYSTETLRITTQRTSLLDRMKETETTGVIGFIDSTAEKGRALLDSKLGVKLPTVLIPTRISQNDEFKQTITENLIGLPDKLREIKEKFSGNRRGQFLTNVVSGNPSQIGRRLIGETIRTVKGAIRTEILGERSTTRFNTVDGKFNGKSISYNYGSLDFPTEFEDLAAARQLSGDVIRTNENQFINAKGLKYSKTIFRLEPDESVKATADNRRTTFTRGIRGGVDSARENVKELDNSFQKLTNELREETGGIVAKMPELVLPKDSATERGNRNIYSSINGEKSMKVKRELFSFADGLNKRGIYDGEDNETLDGFDFVPLKFYSISQNKTVQFRATIGAVSETFTPSWDSNKFVGNPFSYYTYTGIDRSVSFDFKVFSLSPDEHTSMWQKLDFLASLVYPQNYLGDDGIELGMTPPILKFTLGNMYKKKVSIIESLSFANDETLGWETGDIPLHSFSDDASEEQSQRDRFKNMKNQILPRLITVSIGLKILENKGETFKKSLYSFS